MTLSEIQQIFNRALIHTFSKKKIFFVSMILACCGLLVVFFRGLAIDASHWVGMSLTFVPLFLCMGVLLALGIFLIRIYHDEVKHREVSYRMILDRSWETITAAAYFAIPVILCYLVLWMTLGVFVLLKEIPGAGDFFGAILAFAPFLLNLGALLLTIASLLLLYFFSPLMALKGTNRMQLASALVKRMGSDVFYNALLGTIAVFPLLMCFVVLSAAAFLTGSIYSTTSQSSILLIIQWFFIMLPFVALLSPAVIFFFNFAAEAHVFMLKLSNVKPNESNAL